MIFKKLNALLTKRDKQLLILLLIFSIFISIMETFSVSIIMPFIALAGDFSKIHSNIYSNWIYEKLEFTSDIHFIIVFGTLLIFFYFFRSFINLVYLYSLARFSKGRYHLIAYRLFENYVAMPYRKFIDRNSSELTKTIVTEANHLTDLISAVLFMLSEFFVMTLIYTILMIVNWKITMLLTLILAINAILMTQTITKVIERAGNERSDFQKRFYEIINKTFGNFKIIKLLGKEEKLKEEFSKASFGFAQSNIKFMTLSSMPRLILEAIGFSIVAGIIVYLVYKYDSDISSAFGLLSMFVLGLYRLMPSVNRILNSYNQIKFNKRSLDIIHNEIFYELEDLGDEEIDFKNKIELKNIYFAYQKNKYVLKDINLTIKKGSKVGFMGESGSGKSTLIDIIIALYKPNSGHMYIDEIELNENNIKSWRRKIGYIPQQIYLSDDTVANNITMGEELDRNRAIEVLKQANIWEFLEKHHQGLDTFVGEGGVKLSGGQKQRVAIARALYHNPEILILDEATSALDNETESRIMDEIYKVSKDKTLLIIAHRLSTLDRCEVVYKLENGRIV